jgi:hypothetical protein
MYILTWLGILIPALIILLWLKIELWDEIVESGLKFGHLLLILLITFCPVINILVMFILFLVWAIKFFVEDPENPNSEPRFKKFNIFDKYVMKPKHKGRIEE